MNINVGNVEGKRLGIVSATYTGSRVFYKDFLNFIRNFFGWELKSYSEMVDIARDEVIQRMINKSKAIKADTICNLIFDITYTASGSITIIGYADAIKSKR